MNVKELVSAAPNCDSVEIVVREHGSGRWIQGYRVGKDIEQFPCEYSIEVREAIDGHKYTKHIDGRSEKRLNKGEIRDVLHGMNLPMKLIKKNVEHLPDNVAQLQVCSFQPRHIPSFHREAMTHNEFTLDINCYPEGWKPEPPKVEKTSDDIEGQMNLFDLMGN